MKLPYHWQVLEGIFNPQLPNFKRDDSYCINNCWRLVDISEQETLKVGLFWEMKRFQVLNPPSNDGVDFQTILLCPHVLYSELAVRWASSPSPQELCYPAWGRCPLPLDARDWDLLQQIVLIATLHDKMFCSLSHIYFLQLKVGAFCSGIEGIKFSA